MENTRRQGIVVYHPGHTRHHKPAVGEIPRHAGGTEEERGKGGVVNHPSRGYPTEPLGRRSKSPRKNQMTVNSPVNRRFKYNSHGIQTDV